MGKELLWKYEGNEAAISTWLDGWLKNRDLSRASILTVTWFRGEAKPGSDWSRDKELQEWIDASRTHFRAWEGLQHLLRTLRGHEQPLPFPLLAWALDVADGTRERPKQPKKGPDGGGNLLRNHQIVMAIHALTSCSDLPVMSNTGKSACDVVAKKVNRSYEAVRDIWKDYKDTTPTDWLHLDRGF